MWNDQTGSRLEVGLDRDGLDLVQIRSIEGDGKAQREITMTWEEAKLIHEALGRAIAEGPPAKV